MKSRFVTCVGAVVIAVALSGCAVTGSQSSTQSSPPAAPAETPPAAPVSAEPEAQAEPEARAELVTVTAESITVTANDGTAIATFDYFQPTDDLVVGLTEVFDLEPRQERFEGGEGHAVPQTEWEWDGFFLIDNDGPGDPPHYTNHFVQVTVPAVGGVGIETVDGIRVGDDAATIERRYPDRAHRVTTGDRPERLDVYVGAVPLPRAGNDDPAPDGGYEFSVFLIALDPSGTITEFRTPSPNFGV